MILDDFSARQSVVARTLSTNHLLETATKILILRRLSTIPSVYFPPQRLVALETFPNGIAPRSCLLRPDSSWRSGTLGAAPKGVEKTLDPAGKSACATSSPPQTM